MNPLRRMAALCSSVALVFSVAFFCCSQRLWAGVTPRLAGGANYALCLYADGTVRAWGSNGAGQLGDGGSPGGPNPVMVNGLSGIVTIAAGNQHALAVRNDGAIWAWGGNSSGELGNNTTTSANVPVATIRPPGLSDPIAVAGGCAHSLALNADGTVWAWGSNAQGQLGDDTTTNSLTPVQVQGLGTIKAIAAGCAHSLALANDGSVWAWGDNSAGQLGDGSNTKRLTPVMMDQGTGLTSAKAIAGGWKHSVVLHANGTVWGSGFNDVGELGIGVTGNRNQPAMAASLTGVAGIGAGDYHSLAITGAGTVYTWGWGHYGQLGSGLTANRLSPGLIADLAGITQVVGGNGHSQALKSHGHVRAWGENTDGQLGDGTYAQHLLPVEALSDPWAPASVVPPTWLLLR